MKRVFDILLGCLATLILFVPVLLVAVAVCVTSKGPALYWSDRLRRNNVIFKMPKFRSMRLGTPAVATHLLADARLHLTPIGSFLRKSSLDELPQLWSILAGNRCFDSRVPEEINRRIVDHTSDINLTYNDIAREYLLREGLPPDQVIKTGSPMREVIEYYRDGVDASTVLNRLKLSEQAYFLVSSHRKENVDSPENLQRLFNVMSAVAERFGLPVIVSTHPQTRKRMDAMALVAHPLVQLHKPFGFLDYIRLQTSARAVLSDSGTITEESSILNFPALNLREVQERPEGFEEVAVMFVGLDVGARQGSCRLFHAANG